MIALNELSREALIELVMNLRSVINTKAFEEQEAYLEELNDKYKDSDDYLHGGKDFTQEEQLKLSYFEGAFHIQKEFMKLIQFYCDNDNNRNVRESS